MVGSDLDIAINSDLPQAGSDGKYLTNELDNEGDRATDKAVRGENIDDDAYKV